MSEWGRFSGGPQREVVRGEDTRNTSSLLGASKTLRGVPPPYLPRAPPENQVGAQGPLRSCLEGQKRDKIMLGMGGSSHCPEELPASTGQWRTDPEQREAVRPRAVLAGHICLLPCHEGPFTYAKDPKGFSLALPALPPTQVLLGTVGVP